MVIVQIMDKIYTNSVAAQLVVDLGNDETAQSLCSQTLTNRANSGPVTSVQSLRRDKASTGVEEKSAAQATAGHLSHRHVFIL